MKYENLLNFSIPSVNIMLFSKYICHNPIIPDTDGAFCDLTPSVFQDSKLSDIIVSLYCLLHLAC